VLKIERLGWWPGTDLNRQRQPFQGCQINHLQTNIHENTRLTRRQFGRQSVWTPRGLQHTTRFTSSLELPLLLRARSKSAFKCRSRTQRQHLYLYIRGYHADGMPASASLGGTGEVDHLIDHVDTPVVSNLS